MPRKILTKKWSDTEIKQIQEYSKNNSDELLSNFYSNIVVGYMRFRKPKKFFVNLGILLQRTSSLCKSKFQKLEKEIYLEALQIQREEYELFCWVRSTKKTRVKYDFKEIETYLEKNKIESTKKTNGKKRFV